MQRSSSPSRRLDSHVAKRVPGSRQAEQSAIQLNVIRTEPPNNGHASETPLQRILQEVVDGSATTSAAIALGTEDGVRCRAKIGAAVPDVGTRLHPGIGLTGLCLQTGETQLCNNADTDERVYSEACRALGIGSLLVVPLKLKENGAAVGVLEVASVNPNAFNEMAVARISRLAEQVLGSISLTARNATAHGIDLQKLLSAAYVLQGQHNCQPENHDRERPEIPEAPKRKLNAPPEISAAPADPAPVPVLSPDFGKESPTNAFSSSVWLLAILLTAIGLFSYGYHIIYRSQKASTKVTPFQTSAADLNRPVPRNQPASQPIPKPNGRLSTSPSVNPAASSPERRAAVDDTVSSTDVKRPDPDAGLDAAAEYEKGVQFADGTGVAQDYIQAMAWFAKAAAKGDVRAQWELGQGYLEGIGVPQNDNKAAEWLKRAANQGDVEAQNALSDLYLNGWGVAQDYVRAYTWTSIAAGPSADHDERLQQIEALMTEPQLRTAQQRISNWRMRVEPHAEDAQPNRSPNQ